MIHLLWSLLNLFLILSFYFFAIGLIFRGRKTIEPYFKPFVVVVLFLGISGFLSSGFGKNKNKAPVIPKPHEQLAYPVFNHLSNKMELTIYRDLENGEINQEYSMSRVSGLVLGLRWTHVMVTENQDGLEVEGFWDWYLMGNRVFSNYTTYEIEDIDRLSH